MQFTKAFFATLALVSTAYAFSGDATFYEPGLGACGQTNNANELVVALSTAQYGNGSNCGRNINVHFQGKSVTAKVVDKCPGCSGDSIDLSPSAFSRLADQSVGRIQVTWEFA